MACALEGADDTYELKPPGIDLRKHLPDRIIFDGQPDTPWKAGIFWRQDFSAYIADPMYVESRLRLSAGADVAAGPDPLAGRLFGRLTPHLTDAEFAAWSSEMSRIAGQAEPALKRALTEGLVEVTGILLPDEHRRAFGCDVFRSRLEIHPLDDTIVAGTLEITSVQLRLFSDHKPVLASAKVYGAHDKRDYDDIVRRMRLLVGKGMTPTQAARELFRRGEVVARQANAEVRSKIKPLVKAYYKQYPQEKRRR